MASLSSLLTVLLALLPAPEAVPGWSLPEAPRTYAAESLYEYIDGSADLYHSYGFRGAAVRDYRGADGGWITVDIYDMGRPLHAFGIYGAEQPPEAAKRAIGAQGYAEDALIAFWQGPYYVKVSLVDGGDARSLEALARAVASGMTSSTDPPCELSRLPAKHRIADSERYVKQSALGHKFLTEVVSAQYRLGKPAAALHIADLGEAEAAAAGFEKLRLFESKTGEGLTDVPALGEAAFAVRDPYYGEMVAARQGQHLYLAMSEGAARGELADLITSSLSPPEQEQGGCCRVAG